MSEHHNHSHDHHHHAPADLKSLNRAFYIGIGLNLLFTVIEFVVGYSNDSLALLADASHNLSDVASLIISLIGMRLAQKAATLTYTYGYKKASILASLINAILLIIVVIGIFREAIERLASPPEVPGKVIIITAIIGVFINAASAFLFSKGQKHDINVKGAFMHLMVDALVSVGVVISGVLIQYTGWNIIDPLISFVIGSVIIISTYSLLKESLKLTLDGIPRDIEKNEIIDLITDHPKVSNVHHVHIWALSSTQNALTAHVIPKEEYSLEEVQGIKNELKHDLEHHKIQHATLEFGSNNVDCCDPKC